ncbi:hypothetical protein AUJ14_02525 [Candidatus Micrarchaeota archaeon CG1_02_55_22]|nr:MAG: hypothetical protein AUJ14_02525 [Candidatus Micrarchaeota archaeon CG1_02_55_22]
MSVILAIAMFFLGWLLIENGFVFFGFVAVVAGVFALVANLDGNRTQRARIGGEQKRFEAKHNPPANYQLARAGEGFSNLGRGIVWIFRTIFGMPKKKD